MRVDTKTRVTTSPDGHFVGRMSLSTTTTDRFACWSGEKSVCRRSGYRPYLPTNWASNRIKPLKLN